MFDEVRVGLEDDDTDWEEESDEDSSQEEGAEDAYEPPKKDKQWLTCVFYK